MKYFISILVTFFAVCGLLLTLISLYASPDEKVHVLEASLFFIGSGISIAGLLIYLKKTT